jgi:hypothetical protein
MVFIYMGLIWASIHHKEEPKEHHNIFVLNHLKLSLEMALHIKA